VSFARVTAEEAAAARRALIAAMAAIEPVPLAAAPAVLGTRLLEYNLISGVHDAAA